ncbi:MAG: GtrA family protein [Myxococcota bacterium]|nr:GtrA family protein [Myxococcota bacterium]
MSRFTPFQYLAPFFTASFLKFCTVGASGVVVNLGMLALLRQLDTRSSFASAIAIFISIITNFIMNELWTFRDRRTTSGMVMRALRFQLVSLVGALVQWTVFLVSNVALLALIFGDGPFDQYLGEAGQTLSAKLKTLVVKPPEIGGYIYLSQLIGIAVATVWNYLANFNWTWGSKDGA